MSEDGTTPATAENDVDVVRFGTGESRIHRAVPAGSGHAVVAAHDRGRRTGIRHGKVAAGIGIAVFGVAGAVAVGHPAGALLGVPALVPGGALGIADRFGQGGAELVAEGIDADRARRRYDLDGSAAGVDAAGGAPGWS